MKREGEYILSLSYGKDSLACLGAIEQLVGAGRNAADGGLVHNAWR